MGVVEVAVEDVVDAAGLGREQERGGAAGIADIGAGDEAGAVVARALPGGAEVMDAGGELEGVVGVLVGGSDPVAVNADAGGGHGDLVEVGVVLDEVDGGLGGIGLGGLGMLVVLGVDVDLIGAASGGGGEDLGAGGRGEGQECGKGQKKEDAASGVQHRVRAFLSIHYNPR